VAIEGDDPLTRRGKVSFGGVVKEVSLAFVPEAGVGDYVIVHVAFPISKVDEAEAQRVCQFLQQLLELDELEGGPCSSWTSTGTPAPPSAWPGPSAGR